MNWFRRLFSRQPVAGPQVPASARAAAKEPASVTAENRAEVLAEVDEYVRRHVAAGFNDDEEIVEGASEYLGDQWRPVDLRRLAASRIAHFVALQREQESTWSEPTDCDRLERAFAALETQGIVCRQDFACCGNCGHAEIGDEIDAARGQGRSVHGYAFYHMQDTDRAVEGGGVFLAYGSTEGGEAPGVRVGEEIVAALRAEGFAPEWNGSLDQRILVPLEWKRRRRPRCSRAG